MVITTSDAKLVISTHRMARIESLIVLSYFLVLLCNQMKQTDAFIAGLHTKGKRNRASGHTEVEESDPNEVSEFFISLERSSFGLFFASLHCQG